MEAFDYARYDHVRPIRWTGEALELLDQRKLPFETQYLTCNTSDDVAAAIHALAVRGAPAIGIAAAWGVVLAERAIEAVDAADAAVKLEPALQRLNAAHGERMDRAGHLVAGRADDVIGLERQLALVEQFQGRAGPADRADAVVACVVDVHDRQV